MNKIQIEDIDWKLYKDDVIAAMRNEKLWSMGSNDPEDAEMHLSNYEKLREELKLLEAGDYSAVLSAHPEPAIFSDYLKQNG